MEQETARQTLVDAVKTWRFAECDGKPGFGVCDSQLCDGENHQMECHVERARQDVVAAHNKVEQLRAG